MPGLRTILTAALIGALALVAGCQAVSELPGLPSLGMGAGAPARSQVAPTATGTGGTDVLKASGEALNELRVDEQCEQVVEQFDVWEKAAQYAGTNAQLRLQVLVGSDFQHDQLTKSDRDFLRYLAYTTVWVPAPVESGIGRAYAAIAGGGDKETMERTGRSQRKAVERLMSRLGELSDTIDGFPGNANLVLDPDLRDGAFARAGGIVVVSPRFLSLMDERDEVRDVVLAHELSHLYKRHTIKALQYELISSAAGWQIAKSLLGKAVPASSASSVPVSITNVWASIKGVVDYGQQARDLFEFVRATQIDYSKNQELEADTCALRWLEALEVDRRAAWRIFAGVLADTAPGDKVGAYETVHPSPAKRVANIERALGGKKAGQGKPAKKP